VGMLFAGELFMLDCLLDPIQWLLQKPSRRKRYRRHASVAEPATTSPLVD
jgi:hypothetical protein